MGIFERTEPRHVKETGGSTVSNKKGGILSQALGSLAGKPQPSIKIGGPALPVARRGKIAIMGWFDPAVRKLLREISYENGISQQDLIREALNMMFRKYGKAEIA